MPSQANGVSKTTETKLQTLIEIIKEFNQREGDIAWRDNDKIIELIENIKDDIMQDEEMKNSIKKSDRQNAFIKFEAVLENSFLNLMNKATKEISDFSMKLFNEFSTNKAFKESISQEMFAYIEEELV